MEEMPTKNTKSHFDIDTGNQTAGNNQKTR